MDYCFELSVYTCCPSRLRILVEQGEEDKLKSMTMGFFFSSDEQLWQIVLYHKQCFVISVTKRLMEIFLCH